MAREVSELVEEKSVEEILDSSLGRIRDIAKDNQSVTLMKNLNQQLPASYRSRDQELMIPIQDIESFLRQELSLGRLNDMYDLFWLAGRPMAPRALHYQKYLGRDIIIVYKLDMHLVWTEKCMYITPLPRYLLNSSFWKDNFSCRPGCDCQPATTRGLQSPSRFCQQRNFRRIATGFLFSYAGLIVNEYDFQMAQDAMLIPKDIEWPSFQMLLQGILCKHSLSNQIDRRFIYGELRMGRLNMVRYLNGFLQGYGQQYPTYGAFWRDNLAWLATIVGYVLLVLTAMQVGLATQTLSDNTAFQSVSFGFTVFAIVGPLGVMSGITLVFLVVFVNSWQRTRRFKAQKWQKLSKTDSE